MIRWLDLMDLSRKEVSVPFQALLLIWSTILLHFQATLPGIEITKDMLWEAGPWQGLFPGVGAHCLTEVSFCHCSLLSPYKIQYCELPNANHQCRLAQLGEKGRATFPFFPSFHSHFFPFQPWLFQISSLPHEDMVKDHISANSLPVSFPQFPLKGKPAAVGKSPQHLGTQSYSTRQERTEASAELGRTWLHSSGRGHTETRLPRVLRLGCSPAWLNRMVTMFCVHFLAGKGC